MTVPSFSCSTLHIPVREGNFSILFDEGVEHLYMRPVVLVFLNKPEMGVGRLVLVVELFGSKDGYAGLHGSHER